jgi:hypothetical protein
MYTSRSVYIGVNVSKISYFNRGPIQKIIKIFDFCLKISISAFVSEINNI